VGTPVVDINDSPGSPLTAVLLHPHPDMGGDRFNHVVDTLYHSLAKGGYTTARFDFSSSDMRVATAEAADVVDGCGDGPLALVGYSFGASVALHLTDSRLVGWMSVAPYLTETPGGAAADPRPKLLLVPERDQWSPPARVLPLTEHWANTTVATVPGADHFLAGRTGPVVEAALAWLGGLSEHR
jgi:alpha/beta superfamily hydrolase